MPTFLHPNIATQPTRTLGNDHLSRYILNNPTIVIINAKVYVRVCV